MKIFYCGGDFFPVHLSFKTTNSFYIDDDNVNLGENKTIKSSENSTQIEEKRNATIINRYAQCQFLEFRF